MVEQHTIERGQRDKSGYLQGTLMHLPTQHGLKTDLKQSNAPEHDVS